MAHLTTLGHDVLSIHLSHHLWFINQLILRHTDRAVNYNGARDMAVSEQ